MASTSCASRSGAAAAAAARLGAAKRSAAPFRASLGRSVRRASALCVQASGNFGFTEEFESNENGLYVPSHAYGLSVRQMAALGITGDDVQKFKDFEANPELLNAKNFYCGDEINENTRVATKMSAGMDTAAPGQAPPDLPSLLLDGRIVYIGMPLVPAVTELVISELLWLNYSQSQKPVYVYLNSTGSQTQDNQAVGFETEAYAIIDTFNYIRPEVHTLAIGSAYGNAAMLLASGKKGCRYALPHARIQTAPPRMNRAFGSTPAMMIKANELEANTVTYCEFIAKYTGRDMEEVRQVVGRNKYWTPEEAIEFGLIDRIVAPEDEVAMDEKDYEAMLQMSQSQSRGGNAAGAAAGAA